MEKSQETKKRYINVEMVPAKITYFLMDGYYGSINPFMNIFYVSLGLTASQAGMITGTSFFVAFIAGPLWGCLADATGHRKIIYLVLCVGTGSAVFSIPWIADAIRITDNNNNNNASCLNTVVNYSSHNECMSTPHLVNSHHVFNVLLVVNIIAFTFFASLNCYIHGIVMYVVNTRDTKTNYGPQKVFSSIGYAFFNFSSGLAVDYYNPGDMSPYTAAFFVFISCILCITPMGYILLKQAKWEKEENERDDRVPIARHLISVFRKLDSIIFLLTVAITGIANNVFQCFVFLLMEDTMDSSKTVMTLAVTSCVVAELIVFPMSSKFIKFFRGAIPSIAIGTLSYLPRFMLMTYVTNPWLMLPIQLFHGLGLSLSWAAEMEHTYKIFPKEIKLTAITIVSSIYFVAAGAIANILGGIVYHKYGGIVLFRGTGVFCGAWSIFMTLYYGLKHLTKKRRNRTTPANYLSRDVEMEIPGEEDNLPPSSISTEEMNRV